MEKYFISIFTLFIYGIVHSLSQYNKIQCNIGKMPSIIILEKLEDNIYVEQSKAGIFLEK